MRVLVVDDTAANRKLLSKALAGWGHEAYEAGSGHAALQFCRESMPELILMDVMMPGMNGMEAADSIRRLSGGADASIIFVTAVREAEGLIPALESGGDDYVTKPVDLTLLAAKIKAHQRIRDLSARLRQQNELLRGHNLALRREHEIVDHFFDSIQKTNFVPPHMLRVQTSSSRTFSGDLVLSRRRPGGGIYVLIGDFTGKGLSAAIGSLPVAEMFERLTADGLPVGAIARHINRLIGNYLPADMFLAATLVELDATGEMLHYWTGGLPNGLALPPNGGAPTVIASEHMPLGIQDDAEFDATVKMLRVPVDTQLLLVTDGVTDAVDEEGKAFGEAGMREALSALCSGSDALVCLSDALRSYTTGRAIEDDTTMVALDCQPLAPRPGSSAAGQLEQEFATSIRLRASGLELAAGGLAERAVQLLAASPAIVRHRATLHTIVAELVSNGIDHGLLQIAGADRDYADTGFPTSRAKRLRELPDAYLTVGAEIHQAGDAWVVDIVVEHSGPQRRVMPSDQAHDATHGRGMILLEALCEHVDMSSDGRRTSVRCRLD